jgi:hypothetical protein
MEPHELLRQVQEMADPASAQEFGDGVERLRAIADHIQGNLLCNEDETGATQ